MTIGVAGAAGVAVAAGAVGAVGAEDGGRDGAGDETKLLAISTSAPLLLFSLSIWLLSLFSLLLSPEAEPSEFPWMVTFGGAVQRGISQVTPVKLFNLKLPFCHLRQGLPVRSRARRPALMAPWLALGPSLWAAPVLARGAVLE